MANWQFFYLIKIEFLGFRYHGWQKQPEHKSVHEMIDKTFSFIFDHNNFKTLGCSRTDSKVSADDFAFELFTYEKYEIENLLHQLNINLPPDIKAKSIIEIDSKFNVIQDVKTKEYHYFFCSGDTMHPFNAPFVCHFGKNLDVNKMKLAVKLFSGRHNFKRFATKPADTAILEREIISCSIEENTKFTGQFTPKNTYVFKIKASGFLRYQVRLMMGALIEIGRGTWTIDDLKESLSNYNGEPLKFVAPSSGLVLHKVNY